MSKALAAKNVVAALLGFAMIAATFAFVTPTNSEAAAPDVDYRDLGYFRKVGTGVIRFVDPDNGNVCYISDGAYSGGIFCIAAK
jgi:hypothetical protein